MTEFRYTALDGSGREVNGSVRAPSRAAALARLKGMQLYPTVIDAAGAAAGRPGRSSAAPAPPASKPASGGFLLFRRRVSGSELALLTRQLASLINAGLNISRSLDTIIEYSENAVLRETLAEVRTAVQGGSTFWEALQEHPRIFDDLYVNLIRAGEASGQLGGVMDRLAGTLEQQQEQKSRIRSALAYPTLLLAAGFGAVIFILVFLVPRFAKIFDSLNRELPMPTRVLLAVQGFVSGWWWLILLVAIGLYVAFKQYEESEQGGVVIDRLRMRLPLLGSIIHKEAVARFCRTMATLVQGGVPILTSFEVAERAVGNRVLQQAIDQVKNQVRAGEALADPLRRTGVFPGLVTNMIAVGEETGQLDQMLARVADAYDAEINNRMRQLVSLIEPAVILLMGAIIGTIVLSMLIPVLELSTAF